MCSGCGAGAVRRRGLCARCYHQARKQERLDSALERVSPSQRDWLVESSRDGMPAAWIAETVGVPEWLVYEIAKGLRVRRQAESVWPMIHGRPVLVKLHREFAPGRAGRK